MNIIPFKYDGYEVYIDTVTGESFANQKAIARMCGVHPSTVRKYLKTRGVQNQTKTAEVLTAGGLQVVTLYAENGIRDCIKHFAKQGNSKANETLDTLLDCGVRVFLHQLAGYKVTSTAVTPTREEIIATLVPAKPVKWQKCFEDDFWMHLERLYGYKRGNPQCAKFINRYVYDQFPADVRSRLEAVNPLFDGRRKRLKHQHLDAELKRTLEEHLTSVVTLMSASADKQAFQNCFTSMFFGSYQLTFLPQVIRAV